MNEWNCRDKGNWNIENASKIAAHYGYCLTPEFSEALIEVIQMVNKATPGTPFDACAINIFSSRKLPRERIPSQLIAPSVQVSTMQQTLPSELPRRGCLFQWLWLGHRK